MSALDEQVARVIDPGAFTGWSTAPDKSVWAARQVDAYLAAHHAIKVIHEAR